MSYELIDKITSNPANVEAEIGVKNGKNIVVVEDDPTLFRFWKRLSKDFPAQNFKIFKTPDGSLHAKA